MFPPFLPRSPEPVNPSAPQLGKVVHFTPVEQKGVVIMAVAGVSSCALVSILLLYIIISALSSWVRNKKANEAQFTSKQIAVFVTCLLVSDLIQSISGITQVKWAHESRIYEGSSCSIQAATLVMGDLGSTVWSCVIAAHTFSGIALGRQWPKWVMISTVIAGWTFVVILAFIVPLFLTTDQKGPFFSIAGTWCFISSEYAVPRLVIHYVPLFIAAGFIFILYGMIFLMLRASVKSQPAHGNDIVPVSDVLSRQRISIAKRMLWYPVAYLTCILPIAITRLIGLQEETLPEAVWIIGMFFLFSLGAVDTVIYATTRKVIKPFNLPFHMVNMGADSETSRGASNTPSWRWDKAIVPFSEPEDWRGKTRNVPPEGGIQVTLERTEDLR